MWRDRQTDGLDRCLLTEGPDGARIEGTILRAWQGMPVEVHYRVISDLQWSTREVEVVLDMPKDHLRLVLEADGQGSWTRESQAWPDLDGCLDVDLGMTPATNTLPLRRLQLEIGQAAEVSAAWVAFPDLTVSRLDQTYERVDEHRYRYRSGPFAADLLVDHDGLVLDYEDSWQAVARD